ncbi:MAG: tryptophan synthase subunit alpha [Deltaproteobacteria bacterium]|jgi:tryptophan synthase alpha chain|nr:tryptophan synthase subunit alpha [Deltaproteobacteria bacterium]
MSAERLTESIKAANRQGRVALIPFITAGFPDLEKFWDILAELDEAGADVIEIGVPFSDPVADGPVVAAASQRAIANGATLAWLLRELAARKERCKAPLVLMGYYNPFLQYGLEKFAQQAGAARVGEVSGCIVPDLPLEESAAMRAALATENMALIPLVGLNTPEERMAAYARAASGYVYLVSVLGTTGERASFSPEISTALQMANRNFAVPLALGFGLARPEQLEGLPFRPQAVVFGSALLKQLEEGGRAADFMARWKQPSAGF